MVLALSGGGDSLALLDLAADWARARGRRLLALTVDHALHPDSGAWTRFAGEAARAAGVDWRGLVWRDAQAGPGLPARARQARHVLLAEAARAAGARVILTGHTADDVAEGDWMRAEGATIGRLRDGSPSPVWPEGRGLMLVRPLLDERRETLRAHLRARGRDWLEDPANADLRFGRGRARAALAAAKALPFDGGGWGGGTVAAVVDQAGETLPVPRPALHPQPSCAHLHPRPVPQRGGREAAPRPDLVWAGVLTIPRDLSASALAATLLCAGGGATPPRGDRLAALQARLASGEDVVAVLCGARVEAAGAWVQVMREPGELRRRPPAPVRLTPGRPAVWDGRFEVVAEAEGLSVEAAAGRQARLSEAERAVLARLPAAARAAAPVLIGADEGRPVLAWRAASVTALAPRRLRLALGLALGRSGDETTQEGELFHELHGETPPTDLFSAEDC